MRRFAILALSIVALLIMQLGACAGTVDWINGLGGNWDDPANWSSAPFLPGIWDDVVINKPGVLGIYYSTGDYAINSLFCNETFNLSGGSLTIASESLINYGMNFIGGDLVAEGKINCFGGSNWSGGKLYGWGGMLNAGTMSVTGSNAKYLDGTTFSNSGVTSIAGPLTFLNGALVDNLAGGIMDLQTGGDFIGQNPGNGQINNSGIFRKSGGSQSTYISVPFNNTGGTLELLLGTLYLYGGGNHTGGSINVSAPAALEYGGTHSFVGNTSATGPGSVSLGKSNIITAPGSRLSFDVSGKGGLNIPSATIDAGGPIISSGSSSWSGGTIKGKGGFTNSGAMYINYGGTKTLDGGIINNEGVLTHGYDIINLANSAVINNLPGALWDLKSGTFYRADTNPGSFNNYGDFRLSGTTAVDILVPFNNYGGSIDISSGSLSISGGGSGTDGLITIADKSNLTLRGQYAYTGTLYTRGAGQAIINSATLTAAPGAELLFDLPVNAATGAPGLQITQSTINADGTFTNSGTCAWTAATIKGWGGFTNTGTMSINQGSCNLDNALFRNSGTVDLNYYGINIPTSAIIENLSGGIFNLGTTSPFTTSNPLGSAFNNYGTIRKPAGNTIEILPVFNNNGGRIEVENSTLRLRSGGTHTGGDIVLLSNGVLIFQGNNTVAGKLTASGKGGVIVDGGTFTVNSGASLDANIPAITGSNTGFTLATNALTANGPINNLGNMTWFGLLMKGRGGVNNSGSLSIIMSPSRLESSVLNNSGSVRQSVPLSLAKSSQINNKADGVYETNAPILGETSLTSKFVNSGILRLNPTTGGAEVKLTMLENNGGKIEAIGTHGTISGGCYAGGSVALQDNAVLEHQSLWHSAGDLAISGEGAIEAAGVWTTDPDSTITMTSAPSNGPALHVTGIGSFGGSGAVSVTKDYLQDVRAIYRVDLNSQTQFGKLKVDGKATLNGILNVVLGSGYQPAVGDRFDIITYGSREGYFSTITAPSYEDKRFALEYGDNAVTLVVEPVPPAKTIPSVASAKSEALGTRVSTSGFVTAVFKDCFYIEDENRIAGIRVQGPLAPDPQQAKPAQGNTVTVRGTLAVVDGNLTLMDADWTVTSRTSQSPAPFFMPQKALGGTQNGLQIGINGSRGLNNIGLLVKTAGVVTYVDPLGAFYYMDDGSKLFDNNTLGAEGAAIRGVKVLVGNYAAPAVDDRLIITGISAVEDNGGLIRVIREIGHQPVQ